MKASILLVDDEPYILNCLRRVLLVDYDCKVFTAENAAAALVILEANKIDLVITDMCMPHMNGYQFLSVVTALYPSVRRVILTGYANQEDLSKAIRENIVNYYLAKPFDNNDLVSVITKLLE